LENKKQSKKCKSRGILNRNTVSHKLVLAVITFILPINILTLLLGQSIIGSSQRQMETEAFGSMQIMLDDMLSDLRRADSKLLYDVLDDTNFKAFETASFDAYGISEANAFNSVRDELDEIVSNSSYVDYVYFHAEVSNYLISAGYVPQIREELESIIQSFQENTDKGYGASWKVFEINGSPLLISYMHWKDSDFGLIMRLDYAVAHLNKNVAEDGRTYVLSNYDGEIYYTQSTSQIDFTNKNLSDYENSKTYNYYQTSDEEYDLSLIEIVPKAHLFARLSWAMILLEVLAVVLTVIAIPLMLLSVRKIVIHPMNRLTKAMDSIELGDISTRLEIMNEPEEFKKIDRSFNRMMDEVEELKIDVYEKELEKRHVRMEYLSQQVQPHFILNALNILYSYEPEEYELSQKMIMCISKYFRHIVYANDMFVTLKSEMDHIINYFEIQRARYPELFYSYVEYEDDLKEAMVPPLLIQTFAENSIKNSLKIGNRITIFVIGEHYTNKEGKPAIRIRLADTGSGISDEILEEIEEFRRTGKPQKHLGVGIQNSIERMKVIYRDQAYVQFSRDEHYPGTNIEIVVPLHFKEEEEDNETFDNR